MLILDGMRIGCIGGRFALDELVGPDGVEAMEVYPAGHIPPEFGFGSNSCGAVVVWTRRPEVGEPGDSELSWWKRFGLAAPFFAALVLIVLIAR